MTNERIVKVEVSLSEMAVIIIQSMTNTQRPMDRDAEEVIRSMLAAPISNVLAARAMAAAERITQYVQACNKTAQDLHELGL